jgi:hypothetical protein
MNAMLKCPADEQHSKLPDAKSSARMKTYWGKALDRLRASLEK